MKEIFKEIFNKIIVFERIGESEYNLRIVKVSGDSDCLFNSMKFNFIYNGINDQNPNSMRQALRDFVNQNAYTGQQNPLFESSLNYDEAQFAQEFVPDRVLHEWWFGYYGVIRRALNSIPNFIAFKDRIFTELDINDDIWIQLG